MAALALRPHVPRDEYAARLGRLDFALLLVWWFYLYVLIVMPWQYVMPDVPAYNHNLNAVYLAEKVAFLAGLVACWITSKGRMEKALRQSVRHEFLLLRRFCGRELGDRAQVYYSGSLYDIPLVAAMAWLTWIGLRTKAEEPDDDCPRSSTVYGVWVARAA